jgi:predicted AAA+ superfamily ATPase
MRNLHGVIIDEAQNYPELFSYIQEIVDTHGSNCHIVLSGSQNFLLVEQISQTLAGRAAIFELLPLSYSEYCTHSAIKKMDDLWQYLFHGSYPRPYHENLSIDLWYDSYIKTYLERDVRLLTHVKDLSQFQLFMKFCAAQHGQELNATAIATSIGISQTTIMNWLSILEASYIIYRLPPFYKNYKKRLSKRSKLYFYDSAIVCRLLTIDSPEHLRIHSSSGAIFEGFIITEIMKHFHALGKRANFSYWREHSGYEVDLLIEQGQQLQAVEIKSGITLSENFQKGIHHLKRIITDYTYRSSIIYAGEKKQYLGETEVISWKKIAEELL